MAVTPLSDLHDWKLASDDQDLRGRRLIDEAGRNLGVIDQMMVNTDAERVDSVRSDTGELYPVGALEIRDSETVVFHGIKSTGVSANVPETTYRLQRKEISR